MFSSRLLAIVPVNDDVTPKPGVSGELSISLNGQSGNKDEQEVSVSSLTRYANQENVFLLLSDFDYSETNRVRDEEELFLHGRWVQLNQLSTSVDMEQFIQYQYDDFAGISSRRLIGSGLRWRSHSMERDGDYVSLYGAGIFYEYEESEETNIIDETTRANLYARLFKEKTGPFPFSLFASIYLQPLIMLKI